MSEGTTMPRCATCEHGWHGLTCTKHVYAIPGHPYQSGPCGCRGPYGTSQEETTA